MCIASTSPVPRRRRVLAIAVATALAPIGAVDAFELTPDSPDLSVRWDNTVRYNLGLRTESQDSKIIGSPNYDDGDRNFSNGSIVTNRLDVLSEFDVVWKRQVGFRVSAAAWFDYAYDDVDDKADATANTLVNGLPVAGELSNFTKRYANGPSGEVLDAFAFANFDAGDVPINVKIGQHTVYWGESLLLGGAVHGISYAQMPLDIWKGFSTPGSEAKELFRPRGAVTLQAQPLADLSVAAQWFFGWESVQIPESGSYLTIQDAINHGGESFIFGPNPLAAAIPGAPAYLRLWRAPDIEPDSYSSDLGDYGLAVRWSPTKLDATLGFYFRSTTDTIPQLMATPGVVPGVPAPTCTAIGGVALPGNLCLANSAATSPAELQQFGKLGTYNAAYGDDIKIYGVSLSKNVFGASIGAEVSYREDMPLQSDAVQVLPAVLVPRVPGSIATTAVPEKGTPGALGDTWHAVLNFFKVFPETPVFDTANLQVEFTWMMWDKITQNEAVFKGRDGYNQIDEVSKNFVGMAVNFAPTWFQAFPGVDLIAPLTWSQGLSGNAAISFGGNEDTGNWSVGLAADILQKYRIDLRYSDYYGDYSTTPTGATPAGGVLGVPNGASASLSDRGWLSLTFKTTF
jgi:hypothetical protein